MRIRSSTIVVQDHKLLVVRMQDPKTNQIYLFPPGGQVEPGERPSEAAMRETREETGYDVIIGDASETTVQYDFPWAGQTYQCLTHFFWGQLSNKPRGTPQLDASLIGVEWIPTDSLFQVFSYHPIIRDVIVSVCKTYVS